MKYLLIGLGALSLLLGGAAGYEHRQYLSEHDAFTAYKAAQDQAVADQKAKTVKDKAEQDQRDAAARKQHEQDQKDNQGLLAGLATTTARVRTLQAALHSSGVHPSVADQSGVQGGPSGASQGGGSDAALAAVLGSVSDLAAACLATDADRTAIINQAPTPTGQ